MGSILHRIENSRIWKQELAQAIMTIPELDNLANSNILITGATGLICSAVVDLLFFYNDTHDSKIQIIAAGRRNDRMQERFGNKSNRSDFQFALYDAANTDSNYPIKADYIIHGASNAFPDLVMREPVETMLSNISGIYKLLKQADYNNTKRVLYISSSEVYGKKDNIAPYKENEYGYIDLLNPRNSYSIGKRAAETMCASFASEYGIESVIVRPGHVYGPTASLRDTRVSSSFAWSAARGNDLIMKSDGIQVRSYCHCLDCATAILKVLLCGKNVHAYNISNPKSVITIRQMAEILANAGNVQLKTEQASKEEKSRFNPMDNSSLDPSHLLELGWQGVFDAEKGLTETVSIMKEMLGEE